ncbi:helix-turn-helix domain-containing protein [Paenibacillus piscarius]|uniref:helix-turn-helix domain-containing protein n=1 Tax=Paenibacillus piscarius TaxID=1089681 RepID=UPI001EE8109F|nr:helix-turn-helix domain-containing protein [Paenibacillus piscarius]
MTTRRVNKKGAKAPPFTRIVNESLQDNRLSFKARGLLAYMLSKPDTFKFHIDELVKHGTDGKDSVRAGLKELEQCGYIKRYSVKAKGKIQSWEMDIYEKPESGFPVVENPTLLTNDKELTNEKEKDINRYIDFPIDDHVFLSIYSSEFRRALKKDHPQITEEQLLHIIHHMELLQEWEITAGEFREQVRDHFETLAKKNNGSILAFIPSFMRRFEIPYTGLDN